MVCVFLTRTKKNDLVYEYDSEHERYDVKSSANSDLLLGLSKKFFQKRKLKECEERRETIDILSIRVDSEFYINFLEELISNLVLRVSSVNSEEWKDLDNNNAVDEADSLQEFLSVSLFLRRYYGFSGSKKYRDYTFYIIPPDVL